MCYWFHKGHGNIHIASSRDKTQKVRFALSTKASNVQEKLQAMSIDLTGLLSLLAL
jgi:hypothetical protein